MGFLAPAIPWIAKGGMALGGMLLHHPKEVAGLGSTIAGGLLGKKAQSSAMTRSPEEQAALGGATDAATGMQQGGASLLKQGQAATGMGLDTLSQPTSYWSKLLGGNRASMAQATAGARGSITDIYRGAERGIDRSNIRGAQRDVAKSDLNRDRAGKIAGLTTGVQPAAAESLAGVGNNMAQIGTSMSGQGGQLQQGGGNLFSNLLGQATNNRQYGRQEGEKSSSHIGSFLFDILSGTLGGKAKIPSIGGKNYGSGMAGFGPGSIPSSIRF